MFSRRATGKETARERDGETPVDPLLKVLGIVLAMTGDKQEKKKIACATMRKNKTFTKLRLADH